LARIAVTYFDDHTEGRELGYLADALTEQVANGLARLETFEVLPLNAMKPYKDVGLSANDAEILGIDAYVEGAVLGTSDNLSVSVQLIDAGDQRHIESEVVGGNVGAPLAILEGLAGEVSGLLREWLGVRMERVELQAGTESGAAWNLVQQGAERLDDAVQLSASGDTAAAARVLNEADLTLERAEREDPSYITPIIDRGWVAAELASLATAQDRFDTIWTRVGIGHADRALEKDPDHPRALELRGVLLDYLASETTEAEEADSLLAQAEADLRRATELDESRSQALSRLSRVYVKLGRLAEAKLAATKAYSSDPYQRDAPVILFRLCSASLQLQLWAEDPVVRRGKGAVPGRRDLPVGPTRRSRWSPGAGCGSGAGLAPGGRGSPVVGASRARAGPTTPSPPGRRSSGQGRVPGQCSGRHGPSSGSPGGFRIQS
jgi:TolB-like protein